MYNNRVTKSKCNITGLLCLSTGFSDQVVGANKPAVKSRATRLIKHVCNVSIANATGGVKLTLKISKWFEQVPSVYMCNAFLIYAGTGEIAYTYTCTLTL